MDELLLNALDLASVKGAQYADIIPILFEQRRNRTLRQAQGERLGRNTFSVRGEPFEP